MTKEEAKKIGELCSMLNAKERASLQKCLAEIVLRDSLPKLQITPQDVIIGRLKEHTKTLKEIFEFDTDHIHESKLTQEEKIQKQLFSKIDIQFSEYEKTRPKNTLKPTHQK